ncbi:MAG TPA: S-adenosylmethionine:tRNA ribosyltransferase-isomerase, partial [Polyangiaceae bacterium]|nr:S-adenosylmethionine:tRNA ribosyltransferase-isomerase [Polyangiaceae bacterium]
LLLIDPGRSSLADRNLRDLGALLAPGDLLVFNDAATVPASLRATTQGGVSVELRLARERGGEFWAVVLGEGDWRARTEDRGPPPALSLGETLTLAGAGSGAVLSARVVDLAPLGTAYSREHPLIALEFETAGAALWDALYQSGRPIQYSYLAGPLELWHVHNVFASRPWAFELASAAHGFTWELLLGLRRRGIRLASLTHAAGISSTGSAELDRQLPFPEHYEIPKTTVLEVERARERRQRVVAVGTTVVRALESAAADGGLRAGPGEATLVIGPRRRADGPDRPKLRVVDSVISGIHQAGESHYSLLGAFAPEPLLERAEAHARARGYRAHEFGDACLVLGNAKGDTPA